MSNMSSPPRLSASKSASSTPSASPQRNKVSGTQRYNPYPGGGQSSIAIPRKRVQVDPTPLGTPTSSLPPDVQKFVEETYIRRFTPPRPRTVKTVSAKGAADYARSLGLHPKVRNQHSEIIRFVKHSNVSPAGHATPVVILSPLNVTGADRLHPSEHGAVYTPSTIFRKIVNMGTFHLMMRGATLVGTCRETIRYMGTYTIHDPNMPLAPERFTSLASADRRLAMDFVQTGQPDDAKLSNGALEAIFTTGQRQLQLMVLECTGFDWSFYDGLLSRDAATPVSVKPVPKQYPDWATIQAPEELMAVRRAALQRKDSRDV